MKFSGSTIRGRGRALARPLLAIAAVGAVTIGVSACTPSSTPAASPSAASESVKLGIPDEGYTLDKLIEAAKKEGPITVSDTTGKIVDIAKAFTAKYGIQATGVKLNGQEQVSVATREAQAGDAKTDVWFMTDAPAAVADLVPKKVLTTWMPPDLKDKVGKQFQDPLMVTQEPIVFAYNTEKYGDTCPIDNIWALTDKKWSGHIAMRDPVTDTYNAYWWNQLADHADKEMAAAYKEYYGKTLKTSEESATAEWVKELAKNKPLLTKADDDAAASAGAPGQTDPFIALLSTAKFRNNANLGYHLGLCKGMKPFLGLAYTKVGAIATKTKSPNAAKLFVHFMLTEDGIAPQVEDGKKSTNSAVPAAPGEPSGINTAWKQVDVFDSTSMKADFAKRQDWNDFWTANYTQ